jgi:hypothetical protein
MHRLDDLMRDAVGMGHAVTGMSDCNAGGEGEDKRWEAAEGRGHIGSVRLGRIWCHGSWPKLPASAQRFCMFGKLAACPTVEAVY